MKNTTQTNIIPHCTPGDHDWPEIKKRFESAPEPMGRAKRITQDIINKFIEDLSKVDEKEQSYNCEALATIHDDEDILITEYMDEVDKIMAELDAEDRARQKAKPRFQPKRKAE